jgi:hypothetical protein
VIADSDARDLAQELLRAMVDNDVVGIRAYALGVPDELDRHAVATQALGIAAKAMWEISDTTGETPAEIIARLAQSLGNSP